MKEIILFKLAKMSIKPLLVGITNLRICDIAKILCYVGPLYFHTLVVPYVDTYKLCQTWGVRTVRCKNMVQYSITHHICMLTYCSIIRVT